MHAVNIRKNHNLKTVLLYILLYYMPGAANLSATGID